MPLLSSLFRLKQPKSTSPRPLPPKRKGSAPLSSFSFSLLEGLKGEQASKGEEASQASAIASTSSASEQDHGATALSIKDEVAANLEALHLAMAGSDSEASDEGGSGGKMMGISPSVDALLPLPPLSQVNPLPLPPHDSPGSFYISPVLGQQLAQMLSHLPPTEFPPNMQVPISHVPNMPPIPMQMQPRLMQPMQMPMPLSLPPGAMQPRLMHPVHMQPRLIHPQASPRLPLPMPPRPNPPTQMMALPQHMPIMHMGENPTQIINPVGSASQLPGGETTEQPIINESETPEPAKPDPSESSSEGAESSKGSGSDEKEGSAAPMDQPNLDADEAKVMETMQHQEPAELSEQSKGDPEHHSDSNNQDSSSKLQASSAVFKPKKTSTGKIPSFHKPPPPHLKAPKPLPPKLPVASKKMALSAHRPEKASRVAKLSSDEADLVELVNKILSVSDEVARVVKALKKEAGSYSRQTSTSTPLTETPQEAAFAYVKTMKPLQFGEHMFLPIICLSVCPSSVHMSIYLYIPFPNTQIPILSLTKTMLAR